jgi:hypothetical protein
MPARIPAACAALAVLATALPGQASAPAAPAAAADRAEALSSSFVRFFYQWKSQPRDLQVSDLKLLDAGGSLRVLCGAYDLPGQAPRPFLVMGDDSPAPAAAWEPGSFPESDPLYPQLMDNLRLCQRLGQAVTVPVWRRGAQPS